ncbi:MAG: hypothetical protein JO157_16330 [Acetobacteraceae bacterium]|nr:hypothetical protein [Acetobacteraceae bacterium]
MTAGGVGLRRAFSADRSSLDRLISAVTWAVVCAVMVVMVSLLGCRAQRRAALLPVGETG